MTSARADVLARKHSTTHDVQRDELAARRVRHIGVASVRMRRRVARLAEAAQHANDLEIADE